jgi:hypothetical protein
MDDKLRDALDVLAGRVEAKAKELADLKRMVNGLAREAGMEAPYPDADVTDNTTLGAAIRSDQFYGKSPIVAAREYLEMRGRAVAPDEVVRALERGGFDFDAQGWDEKMRLRNLSISMGKNTAIFHRLPNGTYGLVKFYPAIQAEKKQKRQGEDVDETEEKPKGAADDKPAEKPTGKAAGKPDGA